MVNSNRNQNSEQLHISISDEILSHGPYKECTILLLLEGNRYTAARLYGNSFGCVTPLSEAKHLLTVGGKRWQMERPSSQYVGIFVVAPMI